jgi:hypothetical protein
MHISLADSRTSGFKKWSDDHQPGTDTDEDGRAGQVRPSLPSAGNPQAMPEPSHRPWRIPGTGTSL